MHLLPAPSLLSYPGRKKKKFILEKKFYINMQNILKRNNTILGEGEDTIKEKN